jgi:hypothetical protein
MGPRPTYKAKEGRELRHDKSLVTIRIEAGLLTVLFLARSPNAPRMMITVLFFS